MRTIAAALAVTTLAIGGGVALAARAAADVETRGACSASSAWEADVEREYGVYGIDVEVKTGKEGERWRLTVQQNGKRVFVDSRATVSDFDDRYADVDWEIVRPDGANVSDRFVLSARNLTTGETCRTTLQGR